MSAEPLGVIRPLLGRVGEMGQVVIVATEEDASSLAGLLDRNVAAVDGNHAVADWSPLAGRKIVVWPAHSAEGYAAARATAGQLVEVAAEVAYLDPLALWRAGGGGGSPPSGWSASDAVLAGWSAVTALSFMKLAKRSELPSATVLPIRKAGAEPVSDKVQPSASNRPVLHWVDAELPSIVSAACDELVDAGIEVFGRGASLVMPVSLATAGRQKGVKREAGVTILAPVDETALTEMLTEAIDWRKFYKREAEWVPVSAPPAVAKTIISRRGRWPFPQLVSIVTAPTLREDWTLITEPGLDLESGIYFACSDEWLRVPDRPTKADAEAALQKLCDVIKTFPFVAPVDRSATLALLLTAVARPALRSAPMFGISAPTPGSGKSKVVDIAAALGTGRPAAVMAAPREEAELVKSLGAALMVGDGIVSLDNAEHAIRSEFLCQVLTQSSVKVRRLGESVNLDLPTRVTLCATGNGLRAAGDMVRRMLMCYLDAGVERPEERLFDVDPVEYALAHRVELVTAALTVLRGFAVSGVAPVRPALGSFEKWSDLIRSSLLWLGVVDPCGNSHKVRDDDPERERTSSIIRALPRGDWTVPELAEMVSSDAARPDTQKASAAVTEAFADFIERGRLDTGRVGLFLRKHRDRIVDGYRIVKVGERRHIAVWRVMRPASDDEPADLGGW